MSEFKAGYVALVGRPNVGKSTLSNQLLEFDLSIITPKAQTTRHKIWGILSGEQYQLVLLDTPGMIEPKYKLQEMMVKAARSAIDDTDIVLLIVDGAKVKSSSEMDVVNNVIQTDKPVVLAINKIDLLNEQQIQQKIEFFKNLHPFADIIPISASKGRNIEPLKKKLIELAPVGYPFYPLDQITEHPERFFVAEIIREQIFNFYGEEIPYSTAVVIDEFHEQPDRKDVIKARIVVEKDSQKAIIIGKGGKAIKRVGQEARKKIEAFLDRPVFLELWVSVRTKWRSKDVFLKEFGYEDPNRI